MLLVIRRTHPKTCFEWGNFPPLQFDNEYQQRQSLVVQSWVNENVDQSNRIQVKINKLHYDLLFLRPCILFPIVLVLCVYGGYAVNNNPFDILVMMLIGLLGYAMLRGNIPAAPFLIAYVLRPLLEHNFRQSLLLSNGGLEIFVRNEICWIFWGLTALAVFLIIRRQRKWPKDIE